jgi:hypothetical protein
MRKVRYLHGHYLLCARCDRELDEEIAKWALAISGDLKLMELFDEYLSERCSKNPPDSEPPHS